MEEPHLHKLFTGKVKKVGKSKAEEPMEREWETSMFKKERKEKVWLGQSGLEGDETVEVKENRSLDRAIFTYPIKHFTDWQNLYERDDIVIGTMGENFSVLEMDEFTVCIGDIYQVGEAIIQVSEPMLPDWKFARRHEIIDLAFQMQQTGRTGWHFRVLEEGYVEGDSPIHLMEREFPYWTIQAVNEAMFVFKDELRVAEELGACKQLGRDWRILFKKRLRGQEPPEKKRLYVPNK